MVVAIIFSLTVESLWKVRNIKKDCFIFNKYKDVNRWMCVFYKSGQNSFSSQNLLFGNSCLYLYLIIYRQFSKKVSFSKKFKSIFLDFFDEFKDLWKMNCWTPKTPNLLYWALNSDNKWMKMTCWTKIKILYQCAMSEYSYFKQINVSIRILHGSNF